MKAFLLCCDDMIADDGELCCILGRKYEVIQVSDGKYAVINESGWTHWFDIDEYDEAYFGQWFKIVLE
jgi:hypothetical protein